MARTDYRTGHAGSQKPQRAVWLCTRVRSHALCALSRASSTTLIDPEPRDSPRSSRPAPADGRRSTTLVRPAPAAGRPHRARDDRPASRRTSTGTTSTSAGMIALVRPPGPSTPSAASAFTTYAATRIRGAIVDELRGLDWASRSVRRRAREIDDARGRIAATLGRQRRRREVAAALGIGVDEVAATARTSPALGRLAAGLRRHRPSTTCCPPPPPRPTTSSSTASRSATSTTPSQLLPERLRLVVEGYFFAERPMAEIADRARGHRVAGLADARRGARAAAGRDQRRPRPGAGRPARAPRRLRRPPPRRLLRQRGVAPHAATGALPQPARTPRRHSA